MRDVVPQDEAIKIAPAGKENPPARTTVQAGDIFAGIGVEIDCIATLD